MLGRRFIGSTIKGFEAFDGDSSIDVKALICGAPDIQRVLVWSEINGVRRIVEIRFSSEYADSVVGSSVVLVRTFSYQAAYPYDLVSINDVLAAA